MLQGSGSKEEILLLESFVSSKEQGWVQQQSCFLSSFWSTGVLYWVFLSPYPRTMLQGSSSPWRSVKLDCTAWLDSSLKRAKQAVACYNSDGAGWLSLTSQVPVLALPRPYLAAKSTSVLSWGRTICSVLWRDNCPPVEQTRSFKLHCLSIMLSVNCCSFLKAAVLNLRVEIYLGVEHPFTGVASDH